MGRAAYDAMLRDEELLPFNSDDIERMARDELAHGWAVQIWMEDLAAERGTPIGPKSGGGLAPGGAALIDYYRARIAQLQEFVTQHQVVDVPAWLGKIDVVETPKFLQPVSPGASMNPPLLFSKSATGFYFITPPTSLEEAAKNLDANEDFDRDRILSTGAHEAMPGHFLQLSIARRHPDFVRKIQGSGEFSEGLGVLRRRTLRATRPFRRRSRRALFLRRSGNACAAPEPSSIPSWQAARGPWIKRFNSSRTRPAFRRSRRKRPSPASPSNRVTLLRIRQVARSSKHFWRSTGRERAHHCATSMIGCCATGQHHSPLSAPNCSPTLQSRWQRFAPVPATE